MSILVNSKNKYLLAALSLTVFSCQPSEDQLTSDLFDDDSAEVESVVTSVSGSIDDTSGDSYAQLSTQSTNNKYLIWSILLPKATAGNCPLRAAYSVCNAGVKAQSYDGCTPLGGRFERSGEVELSFSQSNCSLAVQGDSVVRTKVMSMNGPYGGQVNHSTDQAQDYLGQNYGGGSKLTLLDSGYQLEILGLHKQVKVKNQERLNISIRTLQPLFVNQIQRDGRQVTSGQIEYNHNLAQYTSKVTFTNLQWDSSCCHPLSGQLQLEYSGSRSGTSQVEFLSCGSAQVTNAQGIVKQIELALCE